MLNNEQKFWFIFEPSQDLPEKWVAHCLDLDVVTYGNSIVDARRMVLEACKIVIEENEKASRNSSLRGSNDHWIKLNHLKQNTKKENCIITEIKGCITRIDYSGVTIECINKSEILKSKLAKLAERDDLIHGVQNIYNILMTVKQKIKSLSKKEQKIVANSYFGLKRKKFLKKLEKGFLSEISFVDICQMFIDFGMNSVFNLLVENKNPYEDAEKYYLGNKEKIDELVK